MSREMDWQVYLIKFEESASPPSFFLLPFNSDEFGKLCYSDDNCTQLFDGQGQCDLSTFRCTGVREVMELRFLDCLLTDVDSVTRSAIANEMAKSGDFERGKNVTAAGLRNYLLSGGECVSDYGPMSHLRARFVARSLESPDEQLCPVVCGFFFFSFSYFFFFFVFFVDSNFLTVL